MQYHAQDASNAARKPADCRGHPAIAVTLRAAPAHPAEIVAVAIGIRDMDVTWSDVAGEHSYELGWGTLFTLAS
jgi:hypothetical protein